LFAQATGETGRSSASYAMSCAAAQYLGQNRLPLPAPIHKLLAADFYELNSFLSTMRISLLEIPDGLDCFASFMVNY